VADTKCDVGQLDI